MERNKLPAVERQSGDSSVVVNPFPVKGAWVIGAIVYSLSVTLTLTFMIKVNAPLHTLKDFLEWLLAFLAITFGVWLIAFLLIFLFVKYRDYIHQDSNNKPDI